MSNTFGTILRLTTFGESHGIAVGGVLDGFPAGIEIDTDYVSRRLALRRPGRSQLTSARNEADEPQFLSGIFEGKSLGTPIGFIIPNKDARSSDYDDMRHKFRPSHADFAYTAKYGIRDHRGGGRSSARETVCRVVAGALCSLPLSRLGITVTAFLSGVSDLRIPYHELALAAERSETVDSSPLFCPFPEYEKEFGRRISEAAGRGDSVGGTVTVAVSGVPAGLGEPLYGKLPPMTASAAMSIGAVKGIEFGLGFGLTSLNGSEANDRFAADGSFRLATNFGGGTEGGISHGGEILFTVAFKPTPSISLPQQTIDAEGEPAELRIKGRHDPCVALRGVQVVRAMTEITLLDAWLLARATAPLAYESLV